jgi:DNA-binding CsgD family transcriptional regulator
MALSRVAARVVRRAHEPGGTGPRPDPGRAASELTQAELRRAEERGAQMTLETAAEFLLLARPPSPQATPALDMPRGWPELSPRELELVALVARGRTDAQIAGHLHISISTVRSHLDRIRDKTSCRRRADLTRLALAAGLALRLGHHLVSARPFPCRAAGWPGQLRSLARSASRLAPQRASRAIPGAGEQCY